MLSRERRRQGIDSLPQVRNHSLGVESLKTGKTNLHEQPSVACSMTGPRIQERRGQECTVGRKIRPGYGALEMLVLLVWPNATAQ